VVQPVDIAGLADRMPTPVSTDSVAFLWSCTNPDSSTILRYTLLLSTSTPPKIEAAKVIGVQGATVYSLSPSTVYYWQVSASNGKVTANSPIHQFVTKNESLIPDTLGNNLPNMN
jgi:hypothetical protein